MTSPMDEALSLPSVALTEARRVFGEKATVEYGSRWATAGLEPEDRDEGDAHELSVWSDTPLDMLVRCLRGMPTKGEP